MKRHIKYAEKDFTGSDLPKNRRTQFFDILKIRWRTLFLLGVILLVSSLPLFLVIFFKDARATNIASTVSGEEQVAQLFLNNMFFGILYIPATVLIFLALAGIFRIYRNILWGEAVFFKDDFFLGIKQNGLTYTLIAVLISVFYFLCQIAIFYLAIPALAYLPLTIYALVILPPCFIAMTLTPIYKNSFFATLKNAYVLYFRKLPLYFLFYLILLLPIVPMLFSFIPLIAKYIVYFFAFALLLPLFALMFDLYSFSVFDSLINKASHPDLYLRGLNHLDE